MEIDKRYQQFFADSKKYEWPTNLAYAVFGEEGLNFTQDQFDGLFYAIDHRHQWAAESRFVNANKKSVDKEFIYAYFKDGNSLKQIAQQAGIGDVTVKNHLLDALRGLRHPARAHFARNGLSVFLAKEEEKKARERYLDAHPLERGVYSWLDRTDMDNSYHIARCLEDAGINTVQDVINNIDLNAKRPYAKLQSLIKRCGDKTMREFVSHLREVADVPAFDQSERETAVDSTKVLEDYNAAKALNLFEEKDVLQALKKKYNVSLNYLTNLIGKSQTMQQNNRLADLIGDAETIGSGKSAGGNVEHERIRSNKGVDER